jgi:DNA ligase-1
MELNVVDSGEGLQASHRVVSGILDGKETESGWTLGVPKNVGKKNETTSHSQALAEMAALYTKKRDRGYFEDIDNIDEVPFVKPMLATKWEDRKKHISVAAGVYVQPKLDGIRCIARADGLWTRTGKPISISGKHIFDALQPLFAVRPDIVLDGELYNHALRDDFNIITSLVRKQTLDAEQLDKVETLLQYHIYDIVNPERLFSRRAAELTDVLVRNVPNDGCLRIVPTRKVDSIKTLDALYGRWTEEGYEGQMIRLDTPYDSRRSNSLMKRKEFVTEEFPVVSVHEGDGNWAGAVKRFTLALTDDVDFGAGVRGDYGKMSGLLESGKTPKWATVRYFHKTPAGIPRFGVVIDYGFEDERPD